MTAGLVISNMLENLEPLCHLQTVLSRAPVAAFNPDRRHSPSDHAGGALATQH